MCTLSWALDLSHHIHYIKQRPEAFLPNSHTARLPFQARASQLHLSSAVRLSSTARTTLLLKEAISLHHSTFLQTQKPLSPPWRASPAPQHPSPEELEEAMHPHRCSSLAAAHPSICWSWSCLWTGRTAQHSPPEDKGIIQLKGRKEPVAARPRRGS